MTWFLFNTYSFLARFPAGLVFSVAQETIFHWSGRMYIIHVEGPCSFYLIFYRLVLEQHMYWARERPATSVNDTIYLRFFRDLSSTTSNIHKPTVATVKSGSFSYIIQMFSVHSSVTDDKSDCYIATATDYNPYSSTAMKDTLQLHMRDQNNKNKRQLTRLTPRNHHNCFKKRPLP